MTKKIFVSIIIVAIAVMLTSFGVAIGVGYDYFVKNQKKQLENQVDFVAAGVSIGGIEYLEGLDEKENRITLIEKDGTVLYDNFSDAANMENHIEREEVKEAIENGKGYSSRYSSTLVERRMYFAKRLDDGKILRISCTEYSALILCLKLLYPVFVTFAVMIALSIAIAAIISKKIAKPINEYDLDNPSDDARYGNLQPFFDKIKAQKEQIKRQEKLLKKKQEEFDCATVNMSEGIILASKEGEILSINPSAKKFAGADGDCVGRDIYEIGGNDIKLPAGDIKESYVVEKGNAIYQISVTPVHRGYEIGGYAILILDVTDKYLAEKMRKEFSANVSHELKTPLHSISGCAELIYNGVVKDEDVKQFSGQIYQEAQRLISLVEDIIELSALDEGLKDKAAVDLKEIAEESINGLISKAEKAGVTVETDLSSVVVDGVRQQLYAIVFNLTDNAIKYNKTGGKVFVRVGRENDCAVLTVKDTGIGINDADKERVFERFYRADKSRSKEGGTGLGLSIVKHACLMHDAKIMLDSVEGEGTTVVVKIPV